MSRPVSHAPAVRVSESLVEGCVKLTGYKVAVERGAAHELRDVTTEETGAAKNADDPPCYELFLEGAAVVELFVEDEERKLDSPDGRPEKEDARELKLEVEYDVFDKAGCGFSKPIEDCKEIVEDRDRWCVQSPDLC